MAVFFLNFYGIKDKVVSITFDNSYINNAAIRLFKITLRPPHGGTLFQKKVSISYHQLVCPRRNGTLENYLNNIQTTLSFIASSGGWLQEFS